jgi:hypothetical protein
MSASGSRVEPVFKNYKWYKKELLLFKNMFFKKLSSIALGVWVADA